MKSNNLASVFQDYDFAWELLESEIAIEMSDALNGEDIAKLLQLYMRGVEKMNSILDIRESYFRNKMTTLMGRSNVIKSLNKPPMAKKQKPLEVNAKTVKKTVKIQQPKEKPVVQDIKNPAHLIGTTVLQQKKRQIQLRMAYQAEEHSAESLRKILAVQNQKQQNLISKIEKTMKSQEQLLNERLMKRKLKTSTFRSRPEEHNELIMEHNQGHVLKQNHKKQMIDESFFPQVNGVNASKKGKRKVYKSVEQKYKNRLLEQNESPKRVRKSFDLNEFDKEEE